MTVDAIEVTLGAGTNILKFPGGHERPCQNHLNLTSQLKAADVYPALKVYVLKAQQAAASCPCLVVITGSVEASRQLLKVFYKREAEEFVAKECGGDWNAINPVCSFSNVPDPGCSVDLTTFSRLVEEIRQGYYRVENILA
jgi:hypothetical protein